MHTCVCYRCRLLHSRGMLIGDSANKSLEELGLLPSGPTHVVCVDPHVPTLIALDKMAAVGVSGAAVVSTAGTCMHVQPRAIYSRYRELLPSDPLALGPWTCPLLAVVCGVQIDACSMACCRYMQQAQKGGIFMMFLYSALRLMQVSWLPICPPVTYVASNLSTLVCWRCQWRSSSPCCTAPRTWASRRQRAKRVRAAHIDLSSKHPHTAVTTRACSLAVCLHALQCCLV